MSALVLALAGTDHHPFARLVEWMDAAAARRPDVRFVVQHGAGPAPRVAEGHGFLAHDHLSRLVQEADAVVCHGGPGTIMDARAAGHVPLCVPRDPRLGEHVDDHQQRFVAVVGEVGLVRPVTSLEGFLTDVDGVLLLGRGGLASEAGDRARRAALTLAARELDELTTVRPLRIPRPRRSRTVLPSGDR